MPILPSLLLDPAAQRVANLWVSRRVALYKPGHAQGFFLLIIIMILNDGKPFYFSHIF